MNAKRGKVIIFSAPSGSGKTTIVKNIINRFHGFSFSISATTRQRRWNEKHGTDYFFLTEDEFRSKMAAGEFLEWEEVYPSMFYGTLLSEIDRILDAGKHAVFDVDVVGGINIKKHYGAEAISFFIQPPSLKVLRERLINRGTDSLEEIDGRYSKASKEMELKDSFDHIIVNDVLQDAVAKTEELILEFLPT